MAEFNLPVLSREKTFLHGLPGFEFTSLNDKRFIGKGCFGSVSKASYLVGKECTEVVVKEMLNESSDDIACFVKKAKLPYSMSHRNVASFIGFCSDSLWSSFLRFGGGLRSSFLRHPIVNR